MLPRGAQPSRCSPLTSDLDRGSARGDVVDGLIFTVLLIGRNPTGHHLEIRLSELAFYPPTDSKISERAQSQHQMPP